MNYQHVQNDMRARIKDFFRRYLIALSWVYLTILAVWILGHLITGDRYVPIALLTLIGPYLFAPLVLIVPLAAVTRRMELIAGIIHIG